MTTVTKTKSEFDAAPPSSRFDLGGWKLQVPGPKEIKDLTGFVGEGFGLDAAGNLAFALDASAGGTTKNSKYPRCELRHLDEWTLDGSVRELHVSVATEPSFDPNVVTVAQIHGIGRNREHVPPLLRIVWDKGQLRAAVKTSSDGKQTQMVELGVGEPTRFHDIRIAAGNNGLQVAIDGHVRIQGDMSFWPWLNYFKTGCYPQANRGTGIVRLSQLTVS
jgi:Alginate lyase